MTKPPDGESRPALKKAINALQLWAIAVGLVISGEYFGWNYGWQTSGTIGFLISTLLVTVLYVTFIFSYTELTAAIPSAGGAFAPREMMDRSSSRVRRCGSARRFTG